jgi:hypothetical protein
VKSVPLIAAEWTVTAAVPVDVSVTGSVDVAPIARLPKLKLAGLTVSCGVLAFVPVPLKFTDTRVCLAALLRMTSVPASALAVVGANFTLSVTVCRGFSVTGNVAPDTLKLEPPPTAAESIVTGPVPVEVSVNGSVALDPIVTLPKLRFAWLTVSCGLAAATPVLVRLTVVVALADELLLIVNVPVIAPATVGAACTWSVAVCFGLSVSGKIAPETVNPVPLIVAELIVTAAVPVEVSVIG